MLISEKPVTDSAFFQNYTLSLERIKATPEDAAISQAVQEAKKNQSSSAEAILGMTVEIAVVKPAASIAAERLTQFKRWNPDNSQQILNLNTAIMEVNKKINLNHTSLIGKNWDFVLKDEKISVLAEKSVSDADVHWLENQLNGNASAVNAIKAFYKSVVEVNENSKLNPSWNGNGETLHNKYRYANVEAQINGKIPIRKIISQTIDAFKPKVHSESMSYDNGSPYQTPLEVGLHGGYPQVLAREYLTSSKGDVETNNLYSEIFKISI